MENFDFLIDATVILLIITAIGCVLYVLYMSTKIREYPCIDFSRFSTPEIDIKQIEDLANGTMRGINGWIWLSTIFLALYYFTNIWSIVFMVLNITIVAYDVERYREFSLLLVSGSLILTCFDLFVDTKEKSVRFHKQWFSASETARKNIVEFAAAKSIDELRTSVDKFHKTIEKEKQTVSFV